MVFEFVPAHKELVYYTVITREKGGVVLQSCKDGSFIKVAYSKLHYFKLDTPKNQELAALCLVKLVAALELQLDSQKIESEMETL